jgi:hypothetical protein
VARVPHGLLAAVQHALGGAHSLSQLLLILPWAPEVRVPGAGTEVQEDVDTAGVGHRGEAAEEVAAESVVGDGPARALHLRNQRSGVPPGLLPAYEVRMFSLLHGTQVVPDGWVGDRAVHLAILTYDLVLPIVTAAALRDCLRLQQHVVA